MKLKKIILSVMTVAALGSCNKIDKDFGALLNNPNTPTPSSANVDLFLNHAQLNFSAFLTSYDAVGNTTGIADFAAQVSRMEQMFGPTYLNAFSAQNFNNLWGYAYMEEFKNLNAMFDIATQQKKYIHLGIGKIIKAYTLITLVDCFGDIPYSEANLGLENTNPKTDNGRAVYDAALALLDGAIADLGKVTAGTALPTNDLFYNGSAAKWKTLAKTLKLKAYIQTKLVDPTAKDKINALLTENDLIDTEAEDFVFQFSSKNAAPDSRHPKFINNYAGAGGAQDYLGNYFMWTMIVEKGIVDPRSRYYFYRQTLDITALDATTLQFTVPCLFRAYPSNYPPGTPYCLVTNGYIGRDHGNAEGIPPDNNLRTTFGIYPAGGEFDDSQGKAAKATFGGKGAGIFPIWLSSFTEFIKAEAALTLGTAGDPKALVESGIRKSFAKVFGYPATVGVTVPEARVPTQATQDQYVNKVNTLYDNAASNDEKLDVIMKEYYISLWGNGIEAYNNYRRTGKPSNMQPTLQPEAGDFIRTFFYPSVYVDLNKNATQKAGTLVKTFWDTNPDQGWVK
ncbi:MAG: SusD/RagB family nutrient-binding outer membrane lipoprotein [Sphingobacteriales bacterium]